MATWWVFKAVGRRPRADPGQIPTFMVNQVKESSLGGQGQLPRAAGWGRCQLSAEPGTPHSPEPLQASGGTLAVGFFNMCCKICQNKAF